MRSNILKGAAPARLRGGAMYCSKCGANVADGTAFCSACGQPMVGFSVGQAAAAVPASAAGTVYAPPAQAGWQAQAVSPAPLAYAGFWLRFVAAFIDGIVLWIPLLPIFLLVFLGSFRNLSNARDPVALRAILGPKVAFILLVCAVGSWLYWGLMESSAWQATLGKKALGLLVTDVEGNRISFGRASGRFCAGRLVSAFPYLGGLYFCIDCLCIAFTGKKQALHDMAAGTLVMRKL
jgi:uncharacterized RDD family membrane protein YckC